MSDWEDLVAAKAAADEALAAAEEGLLEELASAKAAFRRNKSADNAKRHADAVDAVRQYRAVVRADRTGVGVVADVSSDPAGPGGEG